MNVIADGSSYDGKAGAAAITVESVSEDHFMQTLFKRLKKTGLPNYAMPRLVRITKELAPSQVHIGYELIYCRIEANATFKKAKGELLKKTWDEEAPGNTDKLYWLNGSRYERLSKGDWAQIEAGRAKL